MNELDSAVYRDDVLYRRLLLARVLPLVIEKGRGRVDEYQKSPVGVSLRIVDDMLSRLKDREKELSPSPPENGDDIYSLGLSVRARNALIRAGHFLFLSSLNGKS